MKNLIKKIITKEDINVIFDRLIETYNPETKLVYLFGSYVRGEASENSDVDILVEFSGDIGWKFIDLKDYLEEVLNKEVDLVTVNALRPEM